MGARVGGAIKGGQGGTGGEDVSAGALAVFDRAERLGWEIPPELRADVVAKCAEILRDPTDVRRHLGAVRALILADSLNVRREATASAEASAALLASTQALRAALTDPALRQHLARLTSTTGQASPPEPVPDSPPSQGGETRA